MADPHLNPVTGVWDDNYYANIGRFLTSDGGGGGGSEVDNILGQYISQITKMLPGKIKPYEEVNPFFFDEALAKEAATAEYSPYYEEQLTDYISQTERTKSRSTEDLTRTLDFLSASKDYFLGKERRLLDQALRSTNEGYAGRGLYMAGARQRDIKELETESKAGVSEYMTGYGYQKGTAELGTARTAEDVALGQKIQTRETGREKEAAIAGGVLTRKGEAREEYELSRKKYEQQAFYPGLYG